MKLILLSSPERQQNTVMIKTFFERRFIYLMILQVIVFIFFVIYQDLVPTQNIRDRLFNRGVATKKILFWNPMRKFKNYSFGFGHQPFTQANCSVHQCVTTADRREVKQSDAVMFHVPDFARRQYDVPLIRTPHQLYVFFVRESPIHSELYLKDFNNFFNISMTYTADADVHVPYGIIRRQKQHPYLPYTEEHFAHKTKFAVAIISHCHTQSQRSRVISVLQKYMPVDVIGNCGRKKLDDSVTACAQSYNESCMRKLISQYKFYLSFENSLCRDYITEKVYKVLDLPIIPVVYGGGNYSAYLPPNSFINVHDFKTAKILAQNLKDVASDPRKYLSYFKWRENYQQVSEIKLLRTPIGYHDFLKLEPQAMCNLCEYLHIKSHTHKVISDLPTFWGAQQNCFNPETWLEQFRN